MRTFHVRHIYIYILFNFFVTPEPVESLSTGYEIKYTKFAESFPVRMTTDHKCLKQIGLVRSNVVQISHLFDMLLLTSSSVLHYFSDNRTQHFG